METKLQLLTISVHAAEILTWKLEMALGLKQSKKNNPPLPPPTGQLTIGVSVSVSGCWSLLYVWPCDGVDYCGGCDPALTR